MHIIGSVFILVIAGLILSALLGNRNAARFIGWGVIGLMLGISPFVYAVVDAKLNPPPPTPENTITASGCRDNDQRFDYDQKKWVCPGEIGYSTSRCSHPNLRLADPKAEYGKWVWICS